MAGAATYLVLSLLVIFLHNGYALRCWECNSQNDHFCKDPFDTHSSRMFVKDCDPFRQSSSTRSHHVCRKYVKLVGEEKKRVVDRSCVQVSEQDHEGPCSAQSLGNPSQLESCHTCNTDECNSAPGLAVVSILMLLPTTILTFKQL